MYVSSFSGDKVQSTYSSLFRMCTAFVQGSHSSFPQKNITDIHVYRIYKHIVEHFLSMMSTLNHSQQEMNLGNISSLFAANILYFESVIIC